MAKQTTATKFWLFEVHDSDGNDNTIYDVIVSADTGDKASDTLWKYLDEQYPNDETDGGYGTYHPCDCECDHGKLSDCEHGCSDTWECSHGGLLTNEDATGDYGPQEYETFADALANHARYHSLIDLTPDEEN
jgi:hypothetical protein